MCRGSRVEKGLKGQGTDLYFRPLELLVSEKKSHFIPGKY